MSSILKPVLGSQLEMGHRLATGLVFGGFFNEGSGTIIQDLSGNGNTGTLLGGDITWGGGKFGTALNFPGTSGDYISVANSPTVNITNNSLTISAWIKRATDTAYFEGIVSKWIAAQQYFFVVWSDDKLSLYVHTGSAVGVLSTSTIALNRWTHVVGVYNGIDLRLYIDGILNCTPVECTGALTSRANDLFLGTGSTTTDQLFNGQISDILIYNRALSPSEIALLYIEPFCMFEREPIELWVGSVGAGAPPAGIPILRRRRECA